jgi:uncharacterized membrane protein required for colicin V production
MTFIDILIVIVFGMAVFMGLRRGFIGQLASVTAIVIAVIACRIFGGVLTDMTINLVPESMRDSAIGHYGAGIISGAIVYVAVYYVVKIIAGMLRIVVKALLLGPLDRLGGVVVAIIKYGLALSIALNLWIAMGGLKAETDNERDKGAEAVARFAPWLWGIATDHIFGSDAPAPETESTSETGSTQI